MTFFFHRKCTFLKVVVAVAGAALQEAGAVVGVVAVVVVVVTAIAVAAIIMTVVAVVTGLVKDAVGKQCYKIGADLLLVGKRSCL